MDQAHRKRPSVGTPLATGAMALLALSCGHAPAAPAAPPPDSMLTVVGTNDQHGYLEPKEGNGGAALLGGYLHNLRRTRPVVLVDGGDLFQGTLVSNLAEGAPVVRAMNVLGYAASAIGNHEFDFGPVGEAAVARLPEDDPRGALRARAHEAHFPLLGANIIDTKTGAPFKSEHIQPSVLIEAGGVRVGITGGPTVATPATTVSFNVRGLRFDPLPDAIRAQAEALRRAGAQVIVVAVHAGGGCTDFSNPDDLSSCEGDAEAFDLARALPAGLVDVIVAGHTHKKIAHRVNGIPIIESGEYGQAFGRVDLTLDGTTHKVKAAHIWPPEPLLAGKSYEGAPVVPDPAVAATFAADVEQARAIKARPLPIDVPERFWKNRSTESPLGNLVADVLRGAVPGADFGLYNGGGLRADLPAGPLTYGSIFEALPFDNRLAVVTLTGAQMQKLVTDNLVIGGGIFSLSGLEVIASCEGPRKVHVELRRMPGGKPLGDKEVFRLVVNEFLALGGDGFARLMKEPDVKAEVLWNQPILRDVVAQALPKRVHTLENRAFFDAAHPRLHLPGPPPICRQ